MDVGTYLTRNSDGVGAVVTEVTGGSHDWVTLMLETGRTVYGSRSRTGVPAKYTAVDDRANVIAHEIVSYRGFEPGTVALAVRLSAMDFDAIARELGDDFLAQRVIDGLDMAYPAETTMM